MSGIGLMFPGQGAQHMGMGKDVADAFPEARAVFERADRALAGDLELSRICFEGPEERLNATDVCQPGILVTSLAILAALEERRGFDSGAVTMAAGLSLGEYTALVFAGALEFETAVRLVRKRGRYMLDASKRPASGMLSIVGADRETAEALARRAAGRGVIAVANLNAPGQVVLSGAVEALDEAERLAPEHGIRRAIRLEVSGAFHSPLMQSAADRLAEDLRGVEIRRPRIPVVSNVTAEPVTDPEDIRECLARQVLSPVRWEDSVRTMQSAGITTFVEPGPKAVLSGLLRKIDRSLRRASAPDRAGLEAFSVAAG